MCFYFKQSKEALEVANRFKLTIPETDNIVNPSIYNAFSHPYCETITSVNPSCITRLSWGLIPQWASDKSTREKTLNARIETADKVKSFKNYINNRCIIISDGFFEWKHLKTLAGIYSFWYSAESNENIGTFSILTTAANELMSEIHNTKKRMPVILKKNDEQSWLQGTDLREFAYPYSVNLIASQVKDDYKIKRGDNSSLLF
ncbi:MAG: SOS response-associated peptidase family protein [Bacteroidales bacterium]